MGAQAPMPLFFRRNLTLVAQITTHFSKIVVDTLNPPVPKVYGLPMSRLWDMGSGKLSRIPLFCSGEKKKGSMEQQKFS